MRFFSICALAILIFILFPTIGQAKPELSANNAVLMEQSSGRVLYEKNAHEKRPIASITKIMTAIIAIESGEMDETVTASKRAVYTGGSSIYLEQGEKMKMEDLVYGLMLRSGNDAAVAIAEHIGGSVEGFSYLMNEKARWIGMTNTNFENPHGLHSDNHYSTAYDMALLMRYAMENDVFRKITKETSYKAETRTYAWQNKNKLLTSLYEYCIGGKTGFTKIAGRTLVSSAQKNNMNLIAVTLNAPDDWRDHISMYEWAYENYNLKTIAKKGLRYYKMDDEGQVAGFLDNDVQFPLNDQEKIKEKSYILKSTDKMDGNKIGKTVFYLDSEPVIDTPIYALEETEQPETLYANFVRTVKKIIGLYKDG